MKIGVQVIGDDATNTPPAHALAARGVVENVIGYSVYGDYRRADPSARIVEAVADGEVDLAIVWGPLAGYHAQRQKVELELRPVTPTEDEKSAMRFTFAIGAGVGKHNPKLVPEVNLILERRQAEIDAILAEYAMPRLPIDEELRRYADASEADDD